MATIKAKRAIAIVAKIEAAKKQIELLEAELETLFEEGSGKQSSVVAFSTVKGSAPQSTAESLPSGANQSIPDRMLAIMQAKPSSHLFTSHDFDSLLRVTTIQNIRSTLIRMAAAKKIAKASRGQYRLPIVEQTQLPGVASGGK